MDAANLEGNVGSLAKMIELLLNLLIFFSSLTIIWVSSFLPETTLALHLIAPVIAITTNKVIAKNIDPKSSKFIINL